jgi:hypothetical protein
MKASKFERYFLTDYFFINSAKITPCLTKIIYNCLKNKVINENDKKKTLYRELAYY